jgi:PIN domain nuclease of toxin-antitoxin system
VSKVNVLDASAVLAYLQDEKGQDRVEAALDAHPCLLSAVNLCEVLGKLCEKGMPIQEAQAAVNDLGLNIIDFDKPLAGLAVFMKARTSTIGASLGDRACLALAEQVIRAQATPVVFTAEKAWAKLKWPFKVVVIR